MYLFFICNFFSW